jgi:hypothetical protein
VRASALIDTIIASLQGFGGWSIEHLAIGRES